MPGRSYRFRSAGQKNGHVNSREVLRRRYRPARVKVLFVGESPPASGRFFYHADSGLYRAICKAFISAIPSLEEKDFLKYFQLLGCYLIDLCPSPVNHLDRKERLRACTQNEVRLVKTIRQLQPDIIISVVRSISNIVEHATELANFSGTYLNLPYPGRWRHHQVEFEDGLLPVLRAQYGKTARRQHAGQRKLMKDGSAER